MRELLKSKVALLFLIAVSTYSQELPKSYPGGKLGETIKLGEEILKSTNTHPLTKDFVGNDLKCVSCHLSGSDGKPGTSLTQGTFVGIASKFPIYQKRVEVVETLQDRVNNCFMRSMNGKRPITDTIAPVAITTYITWLSSGSKIDIDPKTNGKLKSDALLKEYEEIQKKATHKNYVNGEKIYAQKCAACHQKSGAGLATFPPLWGKDAKGKWLSYNAGAGMSKLHKAALWIQSNMPFGQGGTLSKQEAADVALYIDAQPREEFNLKDALLPRDKMGYYNSKVFTEVDTVRGNFKDLGLNVDTIRGDKVIP